MVVPKAAMPAYWLHDFSTWDPKKPVEPTIINLDISINYISFHVITSVKSFICSSKECNRKMSLRFLVVGCGSIGERHMMNLKATVPNADIDVFDPQAERVKTVVMKYGVNAVLENSLDSTRYDCVFICTPPISHIELAIRALHSNSNVFIEKPMSSSLSRVDELINIVKDRQLLAFVAYNFRFNKGINTIKRLLNDGKFGKIVHATAYFGQYLPDWRPWQDYKKSYTARRDLGGGIIHDGSHEIDYLVWLLGKPVFIQSQFASTNILSADTEAIADILLGFKQDVLGYVHLDFVRREYRRSLEILCENGIIQWSLSDSVVKVFDVSDKRWSTIKLEENVNEMYLEEVRHVIRCIEEKKRSDVIDIENGISTLKLSNAVYESGLSGKRLSF